MKNIFGKNIFDKNIFGNNIFLGKGLHSPSHTHALLFTPYIQLPPLLFEVEGGTKQTKDGLTDRTEHTMIVPFIVLDMKRRIFPAAHFNTSGVKSMPSVSGIVAGWIHGAWCGI